MLSWCAAVAIGLVLLAVLVVLGLLLWRRVRLIRRGGVPVALRSRLDLPASRWHLGVARYHGEQFVWYRAAGLGPGPDTVLRRGGLTIVSRRAPLGSESYVIPPEATVLRCRDHGDELELAMAPGALTGFLSWLESAPPGTTVPRAS